MTTQTFDEIVGTTDEDAKQKEAALAKRTLRRKFASAHDNAVTNILKLESKIERMFVRLRKNPLSEAEYFDVNLFLQLQKDLDQYTNARDICASKYKELFEEDLPTI